MAEVVSSHVIEFDNGERVTFEGLRERDVIDRLRARGVTDGELIEAVRLTERRGGLMADLPTCWYCPECGAVRHRELPAYYHHVGNDGFECSGTMIRGSFVADGTPLSVILDTLSIEYHAIEQNCVLMAFDEYGNGVDSWDKPVLVVTIPATDEAHDGVG